MAQFYCTETVVSQLLARRRHKLPTTGTVFGSLTFTGTFGYCESGRSRHKYLACKCTCHCGGEEFYIIGNLDRGLSTRCFSCSKTSNARHAIARNRKYPVHDPHMWTVWHNMLSRCYDPRNIGWHSYGGRGITVCAEWRTDFLAFLAWALSANYEPGLTLDRRLTNGHYEPGNCRFLTVTEQNRNRRNNRLLTAWGETKCLASWIDDHRCVMPYHSVHSRLDSGLSLEMALTLPRMRTRRAI